VKTRECRAVKEVPRHGVSPTEVQEEEEEYRQVLKPPSYLSRALLHHEAAIKVASISLCTWHTSDLWLPRAVATGGGSKY
jgi:hypothetical protein